MRYPFVTAGALLVTITAVIYLTKAEDKPSQTAAHCAALKPGEMVWVPGGSFAMGSDTGYAEERPVRTVAVKGFWIDRHELTNGEFARFVAVTGYRTDAEKLPPAIPGSPDLDTPGSAVFAPANPGGVASWQWVDGADWRRPEGPGSSIVGREAEPVVQISRTDAEAYARWAGKSLPSEEQWEFAARGGQVGQTYAWGDRRDPDGKYMANYYQGVFPVRDTGQDGHTGRAQGGCYPPNGFGLYDMIGNVWEWTSSPARADDPVEDARPRAVIRGGSFLCAENYCARYRPSARQFQELDLGSNHIGVRFVKNRPEPGAR